MCVLGKVVDIIVPDWVDPEEIRIVVINYLEKKILGSNNRVDRKTYLRLLELMNITTKDTEYDLKRELEFLKIMRRKEKERALGNR